MRGFVKSPILFSICIPLTLFWAPPLWAGNEDTELTPLTQETTPNQKDFDFDKWSIRIQEFQKKSGKKMSTIPIYQFLNEVTLSELSAELDLYERWQPVAKTFKYGHLAMATIRDQPSPSRYFIENHSDGFGRLSNRHLDYLVSFLDRFQATTIHVNEAQLRVEWKKRKTDLISAQIGFLDRLRSSGLSNTLWTERNNQWIKSKVRSIALEGLRGLPLQWVFTEVFKRLHHAKEDGAIQRLTQDPEIWSELEKKDTDLSIEDFEDLGEIK